MVDRFSKDITRSQPDIIGAKSSSIDFSSISKAARAAGSRAATEFGKSFKSVKEAIALPTKAMIAGGSGAALADPFILATAAADGLAAAVEVPFKLVAAGAHMAAAIIPLPFQLAGAAVEGLTGMVGGLVPVVGGVLSGIGKIAGTVVGGIGTALGGIASGLGSTIGVIGSAVGQLVGGTMKVAIQGLAVTFSALKESVNLAAEVEQTKISFDVLIGSATKATEVIAGLRKFAAETPFSMKDVTGAGKQLAGYGVAADQLVPSIKMLGDVSAATGKPLSELTYLYGTLINQDRAYLVDIKQFATAGIPIFSELAKVLGVTEDRTREMVEAGKVGIPEVQKAFVNMTAAGGRFHGLMARQATSFGGLREQLSDAWEVAKTKLGAAVIEELGLKDAAKDMASFVTNLHSRIDEIRPAIRFMGELGRSVASAGMELGKAAVQIASINFEGLGKSFPEMFSNVKKVLADIKDFKINPENVINAGFDIAEGLITGLDSVIGWMDKYYQKFNESFLKPMDSYIAKGKEAFGFAQRFVGALDHMQDAVTPGNGNLRRGAERLGIVAGDERPRTNSPFPDQHFSKEWFDQLAGDSSFDGRSKMRSEFSMALKEASDKSARFGPVAAGESGESAGLRYRELDTYLNMARHMVRSGYTGFQSSVDELGGLQQKNFIQPFEGQSGDIATKFWHGQMPSRKADAVGDSAGVAQSLVKDSLATVRDLRASTLSGLRSRQASDESTATASRELRESFFGITGAALDARAALSSVSETVVSKWSPGADVMDAAKRARDEYGIDPLEKIGKEFTALQKAAALGVINATGVMQLPGAIDAGTYKRATAGLAERAESIVGPARLPDAVMKDSVEAVRLMNQWQSGRGTQTTEALLQQILDQLKGVNKHTENTADMLPNFAPIPQPLGQA